MLLLLVPVHIELLLLVFRAQQETNEEREEKRAAMRRVWLRELVPCVKGKKLVGSRDSLVRVAQ